VETMKSTGTATDYQILSTRVKISSVQSQKVDLETAIEIQQSYLNCLLGQDDTNKPVVRKELRINPPASKGDSLLSYALNNRDELLIDREKANLALLRYDLTKSLNRPIISFMASGGAKNGYVPYLDRIRANYVVGLGISVPLFDGMKTKYNLQQVESAIRTLDLDQENTKRHISDELTSALAYMNAASQKLSQFELQLNQALKAYSLAEVSFKSGTVTNLDLLDASTSVSESRLMLLKARIDYVASIYRLKVALGERLY
jgi:outer membrane protein